MNEGQKNSGRFLIYAPFLMSLVFWLVIYSYTFLQGDDYRFSVNGGSFPRIWNEYLDYYTYGGARMGNLLAGLFLMAGMRVWQVTTALAATGISLAFFYYVRGTLRPGSADRRSALLACVCAVFPGLLPMSSRLFSDAFLWLDGSANYIYPFLLMLVGFLPFYNSLRGRSLPKAFHWISPVCFVAAALLHEQVTTMLLGMCVAALCYLKKDRTKKELVYFGVLTALCAGALVFMLTAPGAYFRMEQENGEQSEKAAFLHNFMSYFVPLVNEEWPWLIAMGLTAVFLLSRRSGHGKLGAFLQLYLCFGALLTPLSWSMRFPMLTLPAEEPQRSRFQQTAEAALICYWILYLLLIFAVLLMFAQEKDPGGGGSRAYLPVLYVGMWASQAIPAVATASSGRARMPLYALALLMIFCVLWDYGGAVRRASLLQGALVLIGIVSFACIARGAVINGTAAADIERQMLEARQGERSTVLIDYNRFDWTFCNVTYIFKPDKRPRSYETAIRKYYGLPDSVKIQYTKAEAGRGAAVYELK
ncbi:DUF6056 family protein [Caproicibacter fermentans]|uniref:Glycosyltransferase RgtA/B/C/D-like domain-containing protein n=1 Tax=Caproicibacter fermentans TaxID=2576756 RepID=A0A7G8T6M2_9FIRM|nr:DUF6056 family protein [Caproicibacter fermentans]QNK39263.1 hypothetical protein HCR03_10845 [Caproicibacter fermentans]